LEEILGRSDWEGVTRRRYWGGATVEERLGGASGEGQPQLREVMEPTAHWEEKHNRLKIIFS
jgi:hypothetical protein